MGEKILIYDTGQRYEIDSDQIYVPKFLRPAIKRKIETILPDGLEFQFIDTVSKDKNGHSKVPIPTR